MAARWSRVEDKELRRLYAGALPVAKIASRLRRSEDALVARRQLLGIAPGRRPRSWSAKEDALLVAAAVQVVPASILASRLGRSIWEVRSRRRKLTGGKPAARRYTPREDELLRACVERGGDFKLLARRLARSADALRLHAQQLGVYHPEPRRRWADWEDAVIRDGYTSAMPCVQIARDLPHRSVESVAARARKLGLGSYARRWVSDDDQRLRAFAARGITLEQAAEQLGRTPEALRRRAHRTGIPAPGSPPSPRSGRRWSVEEDELLRLHQALNPARLAELLERSDVAVCRRLCVLGLRERAQRSPHHPATSRSGTSTPGERVLLDRELARATPRRRQAISYRLGYAAGELPRVLARELPASELAASDAP
jgi:hypothetical protein